MDRWEMHEKIAKSVQGELPKGLQADGIALLLVDSYRILTRADELANEIIKLKNDFRDYEYILNDLFDAIDIEEDRCQARKGGGPCYVYYVLNKERDRLKIGISGNPLGRAKALQTACGDEIDMIKTIEFQSRDLALDAEAFLHRQFSWCRRKPSKVAKSSEWFDASIKEELMAHYSTADEILRRMREANRQAYERDCAAADALQALLA